MSACIAAGRKLVLDQQEYRRKGNKPAQGKVMEQPDAEGEPGTHGTQVASDAPLSPARLLWHTLTQCRLLAVEVCISLRATSPTASMLGKLRGGPTERKKSSLIILLQKLQQVYGKWAQFFLPSDLFQSHCSP